MPHAQEVAWGLAGLHLRGSSRSFVKLGVGFPENRVGILTTGAMRAARAAAAAEDAAAEAEEEDEGGDAAIQPGLHAYYAARPAALEHLSLFNFASTQQVSSRPKQGSTAFVVGGTTKHVSARSRPAVVRVYPRMTPEAHGAEYFYGMLLLHVPWRDEEREFPRASEEALEQQFLRHQPDMQLDHATFADDMAAAAARLQALGSQEHGYGGVAAGEQQQAGAATEREAQGEDGAENEWDALNPGEGELPVGGDELEGGLRGEDVQGGEAEVAAALRDVAAAAGQGRMSDAQFQRAQQELQGPQRDVFDVMRQHIRDVQRANAAHARGLR